MSEAVLKGVWKDPTLDAPGDEEAGLKLFWEYVLTRDARDEDENTLREVTVISGTQSTEVFEFEFEGCGNHARLAELKLALVSEPSAVFECHEGSSNREPW
jgi:hypothetical protein